MTEQEKQYYQEIRDVQSTKDISKKVVFFSCMTNCLFELGNNAFEKNISIKYHQEILEGKIYRLAYTNHSIISLIKGTGIKILDRNINSLDIDALYSLTRMQIETFLILFYLIFDNVNDKEKDFRYDIYKLHGLQKQRSFKLSPNFADTEKLDILDNEINEQLEKIKHSDIFIENVNKQAQYLNPQYAKLKSSKELFKDSGIQKSRVDQMWSIYSNYAHSEYISDRQNNYRVKYPDSRNNSVLLVLDLNKIITSRLIWSLKNLYEENIEKYNSFSLRDKIHIEMWKKI